MEVVNPVYEHIASIKTRIINKQIEQGKILADRFFSICAKFRGFNDPSFDIDENELLLCDLLDYENAVCRLDVLYTFYGYIGRMQLQTGCLDKAIKYAQAALELNTKINDLEGIGASNNLLCDCSIAHGAALLGVEYFKKAQPHLKEQIAFFATLPNHNADKISKLLARKGRPSSFKHFDTKASQHLEETIRSLMIAQNYSRATAKKYVGNV
jgi:tetratricopeptide (TPR) repeat protein